MERKKAGKITLNSENFFFRRAGRKTTETCFVSLNHLLMLTEVSRVLIVKFTQIGDEITHMSCLRRVIVILLALMLLITGNGACLPKSAASPPYRISWQEVVNQMNTFAGVETNRLERAVIAYEMPDNSTSQISVVGNNSNFPQWNSNTIFEVGSMAKVFVAAAVLKLIEEKPEVFGYNVPQAMNTLMHNLGSMDALRLEPHGAQKQQINIRHLLTHTSGMRFFDTFATYNVYPTPDNNYWACRNSGDSISNWVGSPGLTNECIYDWDTYTWRAARRTGLWKVSKHAMRQKLI